MILRSGSYTAVIVISGNVDFGLHPRSTYVQPGMRTESTVQSNRFVGTGPTVSASKLCVECVRAIAARNKAMSMIAGEIFGGLRLSAYASPESEMTARVIDHLNDMLYSTGCFAR